MSKGDARKYLLILNSEGVERKVIKRRVYHAAGPMHLTYWWVNVTERDIKMTAENIGSDLYPIYIDRDTHDLIKNYIQSIKCLAI